MAKVSDLKNSKYLAKEDCGPQGLKVVIAGYEQKDVSKDSDPTELKYILQFRGEVKPMILNCTNGERIQAVTGSDDLDDWIGKEIVLYNDPDVMFAGEKVGGLRVFVPQQIPQAAQQQPPQGLGIPNPNHDPDPAPPTPGDDVPF